MNDPFPHDNATHDSAGYPSPHSGCFCGKATVLRMGLCCQHAQSEAHRKKNPLYLLLYLQQKRPLLFAKDTIICLYLQKKKRYLHGNGCKPSPLQSIKQGGLNKTEMHFLSALPKPPITSAASDQTSGAALE